MQVGREAVAQVVDALRLPTVVRLLAVLELAVDLARDHVLELGRDHRLDLLLGHALEPRQHAQRVAVEHHAAHRAREHLRAVGGPLAQGVVG